MQHTHTHSASNNTDTTNTQSRNTPWQLIGLSPVLAELTLDIHTSLSIGRSDNNDLVLASPQISRQHAKINRIGDGLYIQDLGSSNGTFVNAQRIGTQAVALQPTDEIAFADLIFMVSPENPTHIDIDTPLQNLSHTNQSATSQPATLNQEVASSTSPVTLPTHETKTIAAPAVSAYHEQADTQTTRNSNKVIPPTTSANQPAVNQTANAADSTPTKKSAYLAVILVVIIALVIMASLFLKV